MISVRRWIWNSLTHTGQAENSGPAGQGAGKQLFNGPQVSVIQDGEVLERPWPRCACRRQDWTVHLEIRKEGRSHVTYAYQIK